MGEHIDKRWYDSTDYFDAPKHISDSNSAFQRYRVSKVLELHRPGASDRIVDLGCGWGTFSFALADMAGEVVGVDFSKKSIAFCNRRLESEPRANLRFVCADATATGLEPGAWDLVVAADLFEHLYPEASASVVAEAFRLLRAGGRISVWTPHRGHILEILKNREILLKRDVSHVDYKSMDRVSRMMAGVGFQVERAYYAESHVPGLRTVERLLQGFVPALRRRIAVLGRKPSAYREGCAGLYPDLTQVNSPCRSSSAGNPAGQGDGRGSWSVAAAQGLRRPHRGPVPPGMLNLADGVHGDPATRQTPSMLEHASQASPANHGGLACRGFCGLFALGVGRMSFGLVWLGPIDGPTMAFRGCCLRTGGLGAPLQIQAGAPNLNMRPVDSA